MPSPSFVLSIFNFLPNYIHDSNVVGLFGAGAETANDIINRLIVYRLLMRLQQFQQMIKTQ